MLIEINNDASREDIAELKEWIASFGVSVAEITDKDRRCLLLSGDVFRMDIERVRTQAAVCRAERISDPYDLVRRKYRQADTVIRFGDVTVGGGDFCMIAGPCTVESEEQLLSVAESVKASGAKILRGGAFKPRTSPYAFQGLGKDGLRILTRVGHSLGMPVVSELMDTSELEDFADVDMVQVGAKSMQNFALLRELGKCGKPVLLKRGNSATLDELLLCAEHIACAGNDRIILCERGIRTFSDEARNTLDLTAVPILREKTHLPVIVDPSHATGMRKLVAPMALAAAVVGADGIMAEVHDNPENALCDGQQSVTPKEFDRLARNIRDILPFRIRTDFAN